MAKMRRFGCSGVQCKFNAASRTRMERVRSGLGRLGLGSSLFSLQVSGSAFAFFDFVVLLAHKSLLSEGIPVV